MKKTRFLHAGFYCTYLQRDKDKEKVHVSFSKKTIEVTFGHFKFKLKNQINLSELRPKIFNIPNNRGGGDYSSK